MRAKKTTRRRKTLRKPARVKEARSRYVVHSTRPKPAKEKQLEFSICLPADADAEAFTNKLIELVEAFKGTVGGGTVVAGA